MVNSFLVKRKRDILERFPNLLYECDGRFMTKQREYFVKRKRLPRNPRKPF